MNDDSTDIVPMAPPRRLDAVAWPAAACTVAAALRVLAGSAPLAIAASFFVCENPPSNPLRLLRLFGLFCALPALLGWLGEWWFRCRVEVGGTSIVLLRGARRVEIPLAAVAAVRPWRLAVPGPGLTFRLGSGKALPERLQMDDPAALVEALHAAGVRGELPQVDRHPALVVARASHRVRPRRWWRGPLKFVLFALVPTLPIFRLHQRVAYGGAFGEYHLYGAGAYLFAFVLYWASLAVQLVLYASVLRVATEAAVWTGAWLAPERASAVRRAAERVHAVLYYGGVPAALALRFLA